MRSLNEHTPNSPEQSIHDSLSRTLSLTMNGTARLNGNHVASKDNTRTWSMINRVISILQNMGVFEPERSSRVVNFKHPAVLQKELDLSLGNDGSHFNELEAVIEDVVNSSVRTNHPFFHNQLFGGCDPYGLVGTLVTEMLNTNQITWEIAPAFTLIENAVFKRVTQLIGFENGDAIFSPGGSISNMYGMMLARHKLAPDVKQKGISSIKPLVVFTSQDSHYSTTKGVNWLGIGTDNLVKVKSDNLGRMIPAELDRCIIEAKQSDKLPLIVNATAGTTVLGAFDPLEAIADICEKHGVWLHVDACWGGSLIFSRKHKHVLKGINRADSLAWNPHKMLGAPLQCSLFVTKHKGLLHQCNCAAATYLFQQDKFYDVSYDTGDKSLQCGRKVDGFKLWFMWRARGDSGFEQVVDRAMHSAEYFRQTISEREGFRLVIPSNECTNVCFWYIPKRLRGLDETEEWWKQVSTVAPKIKEKLTMDGSLLIGYQPLAHHNWPNFFRMVVTCHPEQTTKDMDKVILLIEEAGERE